MRLSQNRLLSRYWQHFSGAEQAGYFHYKAPSQAVQLEHDSKWKRETAYYDADAQEHIDWQTGFSAPNSLICSGDVR
jgi:hypothetical protein